MKLVFCFIVLIWLFVGFLGLLHCKRNHTNYEMIAFVFSFPFIPLIAKVCGLI